MKIKFIINIILTNFQIHQINYISKNLNGYEDNIVLSLDVNEMLKLIVSEFNVKNIVKI